MAPPSSPEDPPHRGGFPDDVDGRTVSRSAHAQILWKVSWNWLAKFRPPRLLVLILDARQTPDHVSLLGFGGKRGGCPRGVGRPQALGNLSHQCIYIADLCMILHYCNNRSVFEGAGH
jgi:hypothetical protein